MSRAAAKFYSMLAANEGNAQFPVFAKNRRILLFDDLIKLLEKLIHTYTDRNIKKMRYKN